MAVKAARATTSNDRKNILATTTAGKGTTTTIGSRPYSSANTTTAYQAPASTVAKGTNTAAVKNTATSAAGKGTNTSAVKNTAATIANTTGKGTNTTASMNVGLDTVGKGSGYTDLPYTTPNASAYNPANSVSSSNDSGYNPNGKGGFVTATPEKNDLTPTMLDDYLTPGYNAAVTLAGGMNNPALANMAPHERTNLWMSVLGAAPGIAGANTTGLETLLDAVAAHQSAKNGRRNLYTSDKNPYGYEEEGKSERGFEERPYSNPNYNFDNYGFSDTRMQGVDKLGKYDYGQSPMNSLLDALSAGPADSDIRPYSTPNADFLASGGDGLLGSDASASATSKSGGGSGGGGTRSSSTSYGVGDNGYMDVSALYDLLNQRLGEYDANYNNLLASLNDNYTNALNALGLNYADTEALLNSQLANSRNELEEARKRQLQEAYISRMMGEKNLADTLAGYGLSGGATESILADMRNNYANTRNTVEEKTQNNLRDLLLNYLSNLSNARQRYNENLYNAENSRINAYNDAANYRSQARAGAYEDLYNTLANLTMKGINYGS